MPSIKFSHIASTYNKYLDSLYAYALHLGFDEESAMDAIHDLFYKLCTKHASLDEIQNLKFYLFRSLRNRLIDHKRSTREFTGSSIPIHAHSRLQVENDSANPPPLSPERNGRGRTDSKRGCGGDSPKSRERPEPANRPPTRSHLPTLHSRMQLRGDLENHADFGGGLT